ncbi:MAG: hypothetical protein DMF50_01655 [Acidobacteria bacterium]|nr:MAG: hypothetical protein DMF50_01655 [Acidobacteriota bacterium]
MRGRCRAVPVAALLLAATARVEARVELPPRDDRSVYDLAGVISPEDERTMEANHRDLRGKTGVAIAVVTLPRLEGEALEDLLARAGPEWGLGREAEDRGIVVALAMEEHGVVIATGPDTRVHTIIDRFIVPRLQRNDVSHAMLHASAALITAASEHYGKEVETPAATSDSRRMPARGWPASLVVVLFFLTLALRPLALRLFARRQ